MRVPAVKPRESRPFRRSTANRGVVDEEPLALVIRVSDLLSEAHAGVSPADSVAKLVRDLNASHGREIDGLYDRELAESAGTSAEESYAYADLTERELEGFAKLYGKIRTAEPRTVHALHANRGRFSPVAQSFLEHRMSTITMGDAARQHIRNAIALTDIPVYQARYHYDAAMKLGEGDVTAHLHAAREATDNPALKKLIDEQLTQRKKTFAPNVPATRSETNFPTPAGGTNSSTPNDKTNSPALGGKANRPAHGAAAHPPAPCADSSGSRPGRAATTPFHGRFAEDPWAILFAGRTQGKA